MIFQIFKGQPGVKITYDIPFANGYYDVTLIRVDSFYANAGSVYSLMVVSDKLKGNPKEYIENVFARRLISTDGLILRAKQNNMENIGGGSGFFSGAFYNPQAYEEFSWKDVYLDGYLDLVIYSAGLIGGDSPAYTAPPNLNACIFTFDIKPSKNKFTLQNYLKLENIQNLKSMEI